MLSRVKSRGKSGILMPLSSLCGDYGIGSLGGCAYEFIRFLKKSGQSYWQLLPLVPVGEGNSPYKSPSCFAGEILYIDIKMLVHDGLLSDGELPNDGNYYEKTDYITAKKIKIPLLRLASERFDTRQIDYNDFLTENSWWLESYALFSAINSVDKELLYREKSALEEFKLIHRSDILFYKITQYIFYKQFFMLKKYANKNGVRLIGDIPFYVSLESSDVWSMPQGFKLGTDFTPIAVAGVPPDNFSADGQLWGNPLYDWGYHKKTDYAWWKARLRFNSKMYDVIRIDHFRAFANYYSVPYGSANAKNGTWERGVGLPFWKSVERSLGKLHIIAEDLGGDETAVRKLIRDTGFPDMRVLQFAFQKDTDNRDLPKNYIKNCVCYTGTHDNNTTNGWYKDAPRKEKNFANWYLSQVKGATVTEKMITAAMTSKAKLVIIPMQDYLQLDGSARMNTPGTNSGNWEWRIAENSLTDELIKKVKMLTEKRN